MRQIYAYEVTHSTNPKVEVGSCLIDYDNGWGPIRTWNIYNSTTGQFTDGWRGWRQERLCLVCYTLTDGRQEVRTHGHEGVCGEGAQYQPPWLAVVAAGTGEEGQ